MSGITLQHNVNFDAQTHQLKGVARIDEREVLDTFGGYMVSQIVKRFQEQKTWDGRHFFQSAAAKKRDGKTLLDKGNLRDSYTYAVAFVGTSMEIGSNLVYAAIHHFGGKTGRKRKTRIQPNPVLGLNTPNKLELSRIYIDALKARLQP